MENFKNLVNEVRENSESGDYIYRTELEGDLSVMQGTDVDTFIKETVVGRDLYVYWNLAGEQTVSVTEEMIDASGFDSSEVGYTHIKITYEGLTTYVDVIVTPDMSDAKLLGKYTFEDVLSCALRSETVAFYNNGYALVDGEFYVPYTNEDGVISLNADDETVFFLQEPEEGASTIGSYIPEGTADVYTYTADGAVITFSVYGEYTEAGLYVTVISAYSDDVVMMQMTTYVYLDKENGTLDGDFGEYTIGENNVLTEDTSGGGSISGGGSVEEKPVVDIEEQRNNLWNEMNDTWTEVQEQLKSWVDEEKITQDQFEEYQQRYESISSQVKDAATEEDLNLARKEFENLLQEIQA
ncbi:MAG: hypothetical protein J6K50_03030, partial [Clostridia bacterium]|nr:hypothetical protein [Clostridia bacterium]